MCVSEALLYHGWHRDFDLPIMVLLGIGPGDRELLGCFYLWGAQAPKWEIARCFARAYDRIIEAANNTPRPYIYWVSRTGKLNPQPIP